MLHCGSVDWDKKTLHLLPAVVGWSVKEEKNLKGHLVPPLPNPPILPLLLSIRKHRTLSKLLVSFDFLAYTPCPSPHGTAPAAIAPSDE